MLLGRFGDNLSRFWKGKKVLVTGHTGFKGGWLTLWLKQLGAMVIGFSSDPPSQPNLFSAADVEKGIISVIGDICDVSSISEVLKKYEPEIIFHLAAQSLVRKSYKNPINTYTTNVMGTVNLFEAIRNTASVRVVINITSDKCYENKEWAWGYRENDAMGGYDPYSCSKGCVELITSSYRNSFFQSLGINLASVRAGNVIGGGDWAEDRLVPDIIRAIQAGESIIIRNPKAIRPWQHVLEPLSGYLLLAEKMWLYPKEYAEGWNFGPLEESCITVEKLARAIVRLWGNDTPILIDSDNQPHEANFLKLDCSKARMKLNWKPRLDYMQSLEWVVDWYKRFYDGQDMDLVTCGQINLYGNIITN